MTHSSTSTHTTQAAQHAHCARRGRGGREAIPKDQEDPIPFATQSHTNGGLSLAITLTHTTQQQQHGPRSLAWLPGRFEAVEALGDHPNPGEQFSSITIDET